MKLKSSLLALFLLPGALSLRADFSECAAQCELQFARDAAQYQMSLWGNVWTGVKDTAYAALTGYTAYITAQGGEIISTGIATGQVCQADSQNQKDLDNIRNTKNMQDDAVAKFDNCIEDCKESLE